jgi:hypothetical protein
MDAPRGKVEKAPRNLIWGTIDLKYSRWFFVCDQLEHIRSCAKPFNFGIQSCRCHLFWIQFPNPIVSSSPSLIALSFAVKEPQVVNKILHMEVGLELRGDGFAGNLMFLFSR